jgi:GTP cyclohydrolase FolE2
MRETFSDIRVTELPHAKHFFVEDAPREISAAIIKRFT